MMRSIGHEVFLYAGDQCETDVTEHVVCFTEDERLTHCNGIHYTQASWNASDPGWQAFNNRCISAIRQKAQPQDFICIMGGHAQKPVADALSHLMSVEYGIGHPGSFSAYRVFESYAWMHTVYGSETYGKPGAADGKWFDAVIPGYFDIEDFKFSDHKDNYALFIGRLIERKGPHIAAEICKATNTKLLVAGQGTAPPGTDYVGVVNAEQRNELMRHARCVIVPTVYIEPFGNVAVEAQACGTPVLTTDWGAFTETVVQGVTGYRCRTLQEFVNGMENCAKLDPFLIRSHAVKNYSLPVIAERYESYFERLLTLYKGGWYELTAKSL